MIIYLDRYLVLYTGNETTVTDCDWLIPQEAQTEAFHPGQDAYMGAVMAAINANL